MTSMQRCAGVLGLAITTLHAVPASRAQSAAEAMDMEQVSQLNLNGNGDGGEGMALQKLKDGRRILYFAHEGQRPA